MMIKLSIMEVSKKRKKSEIKRGSENVLRPIKTEA